MQAVQINKKYFDEQTQKVQVRHRPQRLLVLSGDELVLRADGSRDFQSGNSGEPKDQNAVVEGGFYVCQYDLNKIYYSLTHGIYGYQRRFHTYTKTEDGNVYMVDFAPNTLKEEFDGIVDLRTKDELINGLKTPSTIILEEDPRIIYYLHMHGSARNVDKLNKLSEAETATESLKDKEYDIDLFGGVLPGYEPRAIRFIGNEHVKVSEFSVKMLKPNQYHVNIKSETLKLRDILKSIDFSKVKLSTLGKEFRLALDSDSVKDVPQQAAPLLTQLDYE